MLLRLFLVLLALAGSSAFAAEPVTIALDAMTVGGPVTGFAPGLTGGGGPVMWQVRPDATALGSRAIGQVSQERVENRFPVLLYNGVRLSDVDVAVRFKPVSGFVDRAAGLVVRARDANNYYVVRANALENNVALYRVVGGRRTQFAGAEADVKSEEWQSLRLAVEGAQFKVWLNGALLFVAADSAIPGEGRIGLWTKADSFTLFSELTYTDLRR